MRTNGVLPMSQNTDRIVDELTLYPYDPEKCTETIEVDISEEDMLTLSLMALRRGISVNHLVCALIQQHIDELEANYDPRRRRR